MIMMHPCNKCLQDRVALSFRNEETILAKCEGCGNESEFGRKRKPATSSRSKITQVGQPCRKCGMPVERNEHTVQPKYKPGGYYFEWWLRCTGCGTAFHQEKLKRFFDAPHAEIAIAAPIATPQEELHTGTADEEPPW